MNEDLSATAWLLDEADAKSGFPERFDGRKSHRAFPDQLHTFVGDCSSERQVVALVPEGDVRFTSNKMDGMCIIAVVGENVSADYLDFLEGMQISYLFAGKDGKNLDEMRRHLLHDFGISKTERFYPESLTQPLKTA